VNQAAWNTNLLNRYRTGSLLLISVENLTSQFIKVAKAALHLQYSHVNILIFFLPTGDYLQESVSGKHVRSVPARGV